MIKISVVVSVYNEEAVLETFHKTTYSILQSAFGENFEIIYVNDGSADNSRDILTLLAKQTNTKAIHFSRNFGHEAAMAAGLDHAQGDAIVCLDSDLQHPPELISRMFEEYEAGSQIVTMIREERKDGGFLKKLASKQFYKVLNGISDIKLEPNASDFFLISAKVKNVLCKNFTERTRFLRGYIQLVGFKKTSINYVAPARFAGESKYSFKKLVLFSLTALSTISKAPLKIGLLIGVFYALFAMIVGVFSIIMKFYGHAYSGYTTIVVLISFSFSLVFILLGIIGEYIGNMFIELKHRPIYIIDEIDE